MTRYICVSSGKGGVGKTTTAVNLASSLHKQGADLILVDGNVSTPHVHVHLGVDDVKEHLHHAIRDRTHISQLVYRHVSGLRMIPAVTEMEHLKYPAHEKMKDVLLDLKGHADIIVVDSAPGFGREAVVPMEVSDEVLIVTTPEHAALEDAKRTMEVAREIGKTVIGVVVNMVRDDRHDRKVEDIEEDLGTPVIAKIPHDDKVRSSLNKRHPVVHAHPKSRASRSFTDLAEMLIGPRYAENLEKEKGRGMFGYMKKHLGLE